MLLQMQFLGKGAYCPSWTLVQPVHLKHITRAHLHALRRSRATFQYQFDVRLIVKRIYVRRRML